MSYVPLNLKTGNYLLSSMIKIPELVLQAKKHGIDTLGIADNNMYGAIDFYKACKANGVKPIIGCEVYVAPRSRIDKDPNLDARYSSIALNCSGNYTTNTALYYSVRPVVELDSNAECNAGTGTISDPYTIK